jgi:hypothetical protein
MSAPPPSRPDSKRYSAASDSPKNSIDYAALTRQPVARDGKNRSMRRSGGFLLRPAADPAEVDKHISADMSTSHVGGNHALKGKQRASVPDSTSRSHPAEAGPSEPPAMHFQRPESEEDLRRSSSSKDWPAHGFGDSTWRNGREDNDGARDDEAPAVNLRSGTQATLDADALVNLALNLSEGRRRHVSNGRGTTPQSSRSTRIVSATAPALNHAYKSGVGGTLRRHLQDQRRISHNSPAPDKSNYSPAHKSYTSSSPLRPQDQASTMDSSYRYNLSPATLARVDRAREYIELSIRYRQLLAYLPPLRPCALIPQSAEGRTSHLGRAYNPLQLIRNRKARARARMQLEPDPKAWEDLDAVTSWLDVVESASSANDYVQGDETNLPTFTARAGVGQSGNSNSPSSKSTPANVRSNRNRIDWFISPNEELADAYWLEHDQHKVIVEDSHGAKIFRALCAATTVPPRPSLDSQQSYKPSIRISMESDQSLDSDVEKNFERRGRKRALLHDHDPTGRLKHVWHKARGRSHSASSGLSHSDDEAVNSSRGWKSQQQIEHDSGDPSTKHLSAVPPAPLNPAESHAPLVSPGTPNKWGIEMKRYDERIPQHKHGDSINEHITTPENNWQPEDDSSRNLGLPFSPQREGRKSIDDSNPSSPVLNSSTQNAEDLRHTALSSKSPTRTPKKMLPFARNDHKEPALKAAQDSTLESNNWKLHSQSESSLRLETSPEALGNSGRSNGMRDSKTHMELKHRQRDSRDGKDSDSAVRRFFKGGIIGEIVRGEVSKTTNPKRRKDAWADTAESQPNKDIDESDAENTSESQSLKNSKLGIHRLKRRPDLTPSASFEEPKSPQQRLRAKYHLELPSFRPASSPRGSRPATPEGEFRVSRNRDYGFPLPTSHSRESLTRTSTQNTNTSFDEEKSRRLLPAFQLKSRFQSGSRLASIMASPSASSTSAIRSPSFPSRPSNQRHWSITDAPSSRSASKAMVLPISAAEISRLRALLLCSGIKANELVRRAHDRLDPPPPFLTDAARSANTPIPAVSQIEMYRTTEELITTSYNTDSAILQHLAESFRATTVADLRTSLTDLRTKVSDRIERARLAGDEAVGFGALVTGQKTIEVQQVVIALDKFRRKRGRRLKFIRRVAFGGLEWLVTLFLWGVWLLVSVFKIFWRILMGSVKVVRWALWLN